MRHLVALLLCLAGLAGAVAPLAGQENTVVVFAAASLKNALDDVDTAFAAKGGGKITVSYAASSQLMKQIEQGAPADVFISADTDWMDYGADRKLIRTESRVGLLGNKLVLIAGADAKIGPVTIGENLDLAGLVGSGRIVTGDVRAVPVGIYAKAALEKLKLWASVADKMAMTENVRAALALVARGEAPLGIVYETDAKVEPKVKVIGVFPDDSHPPIVYPAALTQTARPAAAPYLDFLRSADAKQIFERYGFTVLQKPSS
jgi:molybdate transport system substrate-binding protein